MTLTSKADFAVKEILISGYEQKISLRVYSPNEPTSASFSPLPVVIYFHGGRFTGGTLNDADEAAATIAREMPACVISVGYSLAPAHPFPAAIEDGYAALSWALTRMDT